MRAVAVVAFTALAFLSGCAKSPPEDRLNVSCVSRLQLPSYPPIAQSAHVSLTMTVTVSLGDDGSPRSVGFEDISSRTQEVAHLFHPAVEAAMRASEFASSCGGKTVRLVFSFQINAPPDDVSFRYPNRFEIDASPNIL